ncbi:hypothetical protein LBMAG56_19000 [Verrucomicrobiota bacterium]|nr:hypothetical protein LBMAG56_19000 [Verrucomicrobiota bacterium]
MSSPLFVGSPFLYAYFSHRSAHPVAWRAVLLVLLLALLAPDARAWGPHPRITDAALETLGPTNALAQALGPQLPRLNQHCWMGDLRRMLTTSAGERFYADDYLLFPALPRHLDHICPEVTNTYAPHFLRAVQALRTETPRNAVRWIGSLLHFVEDTGSPPHASMIRGDAHSKMENWVDAAQIQLGGYRPQRLGDDDARALDGFLRRMDGLIAFSKMRGDRALPLVRAGDRAAVEPLVLECALETSRVVADLLHTLGMLAAPPDAAPAPGATLSGIISAPTAAGLETVPAKIMLAGTLFSTLAEPDGSYTFRELPAGEHRLVVVRPGCKTLSTQVRLASAARVTLDLALAAASTSGNLLRHGDFMADWIRPGTPDGWTQQRPPGKRAGWESETVPVKSGSSYRLVVRWHPANPEPQADLLVRWRTDRDSKPTESEALPSGTGERTMIAPADAKFAELFLRCAGPPQSVFSEVALVAEKP